MILNYIYMIIIVRLLNLKFNYYDEKKRNDRKIKGNGFVPG